MWRFRQLEAVEVVDFGTTGPVTHHQLPTLPAAETLILVLLLPVSLLLISLPFLLLILFLTFCY